MTYPVVIDSSIRVNSSGKREYRTTEDILELSHDVIEKFESNGYFLFGEYSPTFETDDICSYLTIHPEWISHRIRKVSIGRNGSTLYGDINFMPNRLGNTALEWYHRDPNHLRLIPRCCISPSHKIVLITFDLQVCRG